MNKSVLFALLVSPLATVLADHPDQVIAHDGQPVSVEFPQSSQPDNYEKNTSLDPSDCNRRTRFSWSAGDRKRPVGALRSRQDRTELHDLYDVTGSPYVEILLPAEQDTEESKTARMRLQAVLKELHPAGPSVSQVSVPEAGSTAEKATNVWTFTPEPALPNVLILGDSISIGYTRGVRALLKGKANVYRPVLGDRPDNCSGTTRGIQMIDRWLGERKWDVIHFNFGLHDLKHVAKPGADQGTNNPEDPLQASVEQYAQNLEVIVQKLQATKARLIFATTTPVAPGTTNPFRDPADPARYNAAALKIMNMHGVRVNDLFGFCEPQLGKLQMPMNVHFTPQGSKALAQQVAEAIEAELRLPTAAVEPDWDTLSQQWRTPQWIQDAKLGLWAHWGPQSVPRLGGGWYARHMYMPDVGKEKWGADAYRYHTETYGHPSEYGYKDLIYDHFKAEKFDADALVRQFKEWGARYVAIVANHHDNFDLYPTTVHDWNSVKVGPKRDLVGEFAAAARKNRLPWVASVHVGRTFFPPAGTADTTGPKAGVPYDLGLTKADGKGKWWEGLDPRQLYGQPKAFGKRLLELVENYRPDMIYFDRSFLPPDKDVLARYYRESLERNGSIQAIVTVKKSAPGAMLDVERGQLDKAQDFVWQTDTTMFNGWFRKEDQGEKNLRYDTRCLIEMLTDVVSKNGVLLMNVALYGDGSIPADQAKELQGLADWLKINGEAIYATRPWKTHGIGGETRRGHFSERTRYDSQPWGSDVLRFTRSKENRTLYIFTYGAKPAQEIVVAPFTGAFESVSIIGVEGNLDAKMETGGLRVKLPATLPSPVANVIRVKTGGL